MNILNIFKTQSLQESIGIKPCVSSAMLEQLNLWQALSQGKAPWNDERTIACGIIPQLCGRLHTLVSREITLDIQDEVLRQPMLRLNAQIEKLVDFLTMFGSAIVRPIFADGKIQMEIISLGNYLPLKYDFSDTLTSCVILKKIQEKKDTYLLCEQHEFDGNAQTHTVENLLYKISGENFRRVPLTATEQTAAITETYTWQGVKMPLLVEFRNNAANYIDGSQVPVALIAGAEDLIKEADLHFERMSWEMQAGEKRLFADSDLFEKKVLRGGKQTEVKLTGNLNRLITKIDGDGTGEDGKIHEWSPELRTAALNDYLQQVFRRIELTLNMGKGTISDMESQVQTATQYNGGRQELYAIIDKIETEIENKYQLCAEVFSHVAAAYNLGNVVGKVFIEWNDSQTRKDVIQTKTQDMLEVQHGIMQKFEYRMKHYGEDEATAKANVVVEEKPAFNPFE